MSPSVSPPPWPRLALRPSSWALAAAALLGAACGDVPTPPPADAAARGAAQASAQGSVPEPSAGAAGYPRVVAAPDGTELHLAARPARIFPANASALDYLADLVSAERVVAVPVPAESWTSATLGEDWNELPRVPEYEGEVVLAFGADLVVTHEWQAADTAHVLRQAGVAVACLPEFRDLDSARRSLLFLGEVLGEQARAEEVLRSLDRRVAALAPPESWAGLSAAAYTNYGTVGWVAGAGTTADALFELCGLANAAAEAGLAGHQRLDIEGLLDVDPDVLVVGGPEAGQEASPTLRYLRGEPALTSLRALREDRVVVLPAALFGTNSHRLVDAAERLAREVEALLERDG